MRLVGFVCAVLLLAGCNDDPASPSEAWRSACADKSDAELRTYVVGLIRDGVDEGDVYDDVKAACPKRLPAAGFGR